MNHVKIILGTLGIAVGGVILYRQRRAVSQSLIQGDAGLENKRDGAQVQVQSRTPESINLKMWVPPKEAAPYLEKIAKTEALYGLPQNMLARLLYQESHYRQDIITGKTKSKVGAIGIAQFMPATAKAYGVNPYDADSSIDGAGRLLRDLFKRFGAWDKALAGYNWGQGNVAKKGLEKAPNETKSYIAQILADVGIV